MISIPIPVTKADIDELETGVNVAYVLHNLLHRIEVLEIDSAKDDERIAYLEAELEARIKFAEQFQTAKA